MDMPTTHELVALVSAEDLRRQMNELDTLRERVDDLLAANTARAEAQLTRRVRAFMQGIGQAVEWTPAIPCSQTVRLRLRLVVEECLELVAACTGGSVSANESLELAWRLVEEVISRVRASDVDLPEVADALSDLRVVIVGSDAAFGINGDAVDALVMDANMKKLEGKDDAHGKRQKPPGWTPPDIAAELRRQGWDGDAT